MGRTSRFLSLYRNAALMLLNLTVLLALANGAFYLLFRIKDAHTTRRNLENVSRIHQNPALRTVYPDMDAQSISQLIRETWSRPYVYEPFTQFSERPFTGRFVNVSEAGYRLSKHQGPWPPDESNYNIFLFGGSTTFGYGVPDHQTVASYLEESLSAVGSRRVRVYNFGRGSYVSRQERVLLEELLIAGFRPDMALFIDGLNEFAFPDGPAETARLRAAFGMRNVGLDRFRFIDDLPMTRLAHFIRRTVRNALEGREQLRPENVEPTAAFDDGKYHSPAVIARVIAGYFENQALIRAVTKANGIVAVFVWQPIPLYKYDLRHHLFATRDFGSNFFALYGYRYMERRVKEHPPGRDFIWCADMQESLSEPLYVDKVHYTARMSALFAEEIAVRLRERGLLE